MLPLSTLVTNMPQSPGKQGSFTPSAISNPSAFQSTSSCQHSSSSTLYKAVTKLIWLVNPKPPALLWDCPFAMTEGDPVPKTEPVSGCHLPLSHCRPTVHQRPRALLPPSVRVPSASAVTQEGHLRQSARTSAGKDASAPWEGTPNLKTSNCDTGGRGTRTGRKDTKKAYSLPFKLHNFRLPLHGVCVDGRVVGAVSHQLPEPSLLFQLGLHLLPVERETPHRVTAHTSSVGLSLGLHASFPINLQHQVQAAGYWWVLCSFCFIVFLKTQKFFPHVSGAGVEHPAVKGPSVNTS